jgi:hypothetical protein
VGGVVRPAGHTLRRGHGTWRRFGSDRVLALRALRVGDSGLNAGDTVAQLGAQFLERIPLTQPQPPAPTTVAAGRVGEFGELVVVGQGELVVRPLRQPVDQSVQLSPRVDPPEEVQEVEPEVVVQVVLDGLAGAF